MTETLSPTKRGSTDSGMEGEVSGFSLFLWDHEPAGKRNTQIKQQ